MTNEIKQEASKLPEKTYSADEAKKILLRAINERYDSNSLLRKIAKNRLPKLLAGEKQTKKDDEDIITLSIAFSIETSHALIESVKEKYRPLVFQFEKELEKEFDCKTASEKAVANMAAMSYVRKMAFSNKLESNQTYLGSDQEGYRNFLSREIDRSHRQFLSSLEILRCQKQPALKVNVKTNTAFFGEKQQFNNNQNQNNESK